MFNVFTSPADPAEKCPKTSLPHKLVQRPDDNEATVTERLKVYDDKTRPLIDFYRGKQLLYGINASGDPADVQERLTAALEHSRLG